MPIFVYLALRLKDLIIHNFLNQLKSLFPTLIDLDHLFYKKLLKFVALKLFFLLSIFFLIYYVFSLKY